MPGERHGGQLGIADLDPGRVGAQVKLGADRRPVRVVVAPIRSTMTSWETSGRPRQFIEICENSRCSIRFHLEVPDGKWHTVTTRPVSAASLPSSTFHSRLR
jgi:hypothetical protein